MSLFSTTLAILLWFGVHNVAAEFRLPHEIYGVSRLWNIVATGGAKERLPTGLGKRARSRVSYTNSSIPQLSNSWQSLTIDPPEGEGEEDIIILWMTIIQI